MSAKEKQPVFPVWMMSIVLLSALSFAWALGLEDVLAFQIAARLILWFALLAAFVAALYGRRPPPLFVYELSAEQVAARALAIRCGLLGLLVFSNAMSAMFSSWPANTFNFEYLLALPFILLLVPRYVAWAGRRIGIQEDNHERFGQVLKRQRAWCWAEQKPYLLAWCVKFFFIPMMYSFLVLAMEGMVLFSWQWSPTTLVLGLISFGLCFDLLIAFGGYLFSMRLLGGEIRSVDSNWLGWFACMICYPPLLVVFHYVKQQVDDIVWSDWLLPNEPLYWLWAALVTGTWLVYWLATASFGLKFSNLSWRGLIDRGPYRYTKHPAYLAKNLYWWLHTVPFIGVHDGADLLRNILGLTFVSLVYYLRAKTEEAHLLAFPEYATYSARIEREGVFARMRGVFRRRI
ncbi:isoprenylcysteine carboxylmethyltransferase family protein [Pseudomonas spirodelae]|uniref:DUF1295 domain-containing protein n=1 Tax=Pseudomonas spirodelae TaxID=3101751 RepID=A0ABU5PAU6_9PSED|nr:isoprenylcysteine carboxylmethyltransferase family protein [Pseudomonas sp. T5W1]MEA1606756.1 hypothetical protein [Pseudomonas sp. T5W1]